MKKENKIKVYIIIDGYDCESSNIVAVYDSKEKAIKNIKKWKKHMIENYYDHIIDLKITPGEKLPQGWRFGDHYRIHQIQDLK